MPAQARLFPSNPDRCLMALEDDALNRRLLSSRLLVSGPICGRADQDRHNAFVRRHQSGLDAAHPMVLTHFRRNDGDAAMHAMNVCITAAANRHAQAATAAGRDRFCPTAALLFDRLMAAPDASAVVAIAVEANEPDTPVLPPRC